MFTSDEAMIEAVFEYCRERLSHDTVPLTSGAGPNSFDDVPQGLIGPHGRDFSEVLSVFADKLATSVISPDSPRFLSFVPVAPTKAALLFDMIVSCFALHGTSWLEVAGVVAAENQALRALADMAGLPASAGGCFVSGGSGGNLSGLFTARDTAAWRLGRAPDRPRIAISGDAHSSVAKVLHILGVEPLVVPSPDHRLTGAALRAALDGDPRAGDVIGVVATAGTTNAGIIDDLAGVGEVARERSLWFHVDAAYGGAALLAPSVRERFSGIERADSLVIDPHKWLFAPFDCAALIYRDPAIAARVHSQEAAYLDAMRDPDEESRNPSDYAFHLTRRARGLPLWFSLAVHGTEAYKDAIETVLSVARYAADRIAAAPHLELVREPELSVVLLRRPGWTWSDYEAWSERLLAQQIGFVLPSTWEGEAVARLCFLHPETTTDVVDELLSSIS